MTTNPADPDFQAALANVLVAASQSGPPVAVCSVISAPPGVGVAVGSRLVVFADGRTLGALPPGPLADAIRADALEAIPRHLAETHAFTATGERLEGRRAVGAAEAVVEVFVEIVEPAPTLLIVGGGHVGLSIARLGEFLGMSVAVLDDREDFANRERFPFAEYVLCGEVDDELARFPIHGGTYVVLVSRGHKVDELALRQVVGRGAAYVGMIGSKRRTRTVLEHLRAEGLDAAALAQVYTPIGLDLGAETPEEIAISVLGEILLVRRGGTGQPLSDAGQARAALPAPARPLD